jgi:hypothetical protein
MFIDIFHVVSTHQRSIFPENTAILCFTKAALDVADGDKKNVTYRSSWKDFTRLLTAFFYRPTSNEGTPALRVIDTTST